MFEGIDTLADYWEKRAVKFARHEDGLAAVCSFGMPRFYNRSIERCQKRALTPWLNSVNDKDVLEVGCGVGRWTSILASGGNRVCAVDISPTMVAETSRRLKENSQVAELQVSDVASFSSERRFDYALSVTVVQHIMDDNEFSRAIQNIAQHLRPGGQFVLLEAAPTDGSERCNSPIFRARPLSEYIDTLTTCGFTVDSVGGVDPMPFKTWTMPYLNALPRPLAVAAIGAVTALSLPLDLLLASRMTKRSWHKIIVATRAT